MVIDLCNSGLCFAYIRSNNAGLDLDLGASHENDLAAIILLSV